MDSKYFSKPLLLPSNGFEYEKICFISPPTFEFILFNDDPFFSDSELEKQISFVRKYTTADPLKLYTFDFYYILANYHMYLYEGADYEKPVRCLNCGTVHRLGVDLKQLPNLKILSSRASKELSMDMKDANITYRRRKIIDNLEYSQAVIDEDKFDTPEKKLIKFLLPQIVNIVHKENTYDQPEDIVKLLQYQSRKDLFFLYDSFTNKDFGLDDRVRYTCTSCKFKNYTSLYDDVEMSTYVPSEQNSQGAKLFFEQIINANRMRFVPYNEFKNIPLSYFKMVNDTMSELGIDHLTLGRIG
jgi:hypothetical protein